MNFGKKRKPLSRLLLILTVVASACGGKGEASSVIASVNGREVQKTAFERFLAIRLGESAGGEMPAPLRNKLRSQMLDEYLTRRLVVLAAENAGLTINDSEVTQVAQENPQHKSAASDDEARRELEEDLLIEKYYAQKVLREVRVSAEEVDAYIEANKDRLTNKPGFYVREIRVHSREEAERLRREIVEQGGDFAAVARAHSTAANAEAGGLTRYDEGQMPAVLEKAIQALAVGAISPVVQSNYGFHLFQLERRTQPYAPEERRSQLDERRAYLKEEYITRKNQEAVDAAINRLIATATIKLHSAALGFSYEGRFGHN